MAWTEISSRQYRRGRLRYASDLMDGEWALLEPLMPAASRIGRPRATDLRSVVDVILHCFDGLPVAPAPQRVSALLDRAGLFLRMVARRNLRVDQSHARHGGA